MDNTFGREQHGWELLWAAVVRVSSGGMDERAGKRRHRMRVLTGRMGERAGKRRYGLELRRAASIRVSPGGMNESFIGRRRMRAAEWIIFLGMAFEKKTGGGIKGLAASEESGTALMAAYVSYCHFLVSIS